VYNYCIGVTVSGIVSRMVDRDFASQVVDVNPSIMVHGGRHCTVYAHLLVHKNLLHNMVLDAVSVLHLPASLCGKPVTATGAVQNPSM